MSKSSEQVSTSDDRLVEKLLEHAAPRPAPPSDDEAIVREAVLAEWQTVTGRIRMRQRVLRFAVAATVLLGVALLLNALRVDDLPAVQVASIDRSHGPIYLLGEQSELQEMKGLHAISAGQIVVSGDAAGIGFAWGNGGSLRIGENTRVEFTSTDALFLHHGRIYFDSHSSQTGATLRIDTEHGSVRHLGTQYMAFADVHRLQVSVRQGEVEVDGHYADTATAAEGQQLTLTGAARPSIVNFSGFGEAWAWVEATAPAAEVDGKTVHEFLLWVARETGLTVAYESAAAEEQARAGILRGNVDDMDPRDELRLRMSGEDLDYRIQGGTIYVSFVGTFSRP